MDTLVSRLERVTVRLETVVTTQEKHDERMCRLERYVYTAIGGLLLLGLLELWPVVAKAVLS